jgi:hypothetical protein
MLSYFLLYLGVNLIFSTWSKRLKWLKTILNFILFYCTYSSTFVYFNITIYIFLMKRSFGFNSFFIILFSFFNTFFLIFNIFTWSFFFNNFFNFYSRWNLFLSFFYKNWRFFRTTKIESFHHSKIKVMLLQWWQHPIKKHI